MTTFYYYQDQLLFVESSRFNDSAGGKKSISKGKYYFNNGKLAFKKDTDTNHGETYYEYFVQLHLKMAEKVFQVDQAWIGPPGTGDGLFGSRRKVR